MSDNQRNLGVHAAVILAGGASSRMGGRDKPLMQIGGRPMLARVIDRLRPQVERMMLSANGDVGRFSSFGLPVEQDEVGVGPLAGLFAGMRWSEKNLPEARFIVSVASDTPFFPTDLVERLAEGCGRDENTVALAASTAGTHPVFGLWPVEACRRARKVSAERGPSEGPRLRRPLHAPERPLRRYRAAERRSSRSILQRQHARGRYPGRGDCRGARRTKGSDLCPGVGFAYQAQICVSVSSFTQHAGSLCERRYRPGSATFPPPSL